MRFREAAEAARPPFPRYCGLVSKKAARKTRAAGRPAPPPVGARRPLPRKWLYLGFGGGAVVAVVILILPSQLGGSDGSEKPSGSIAGAEAVVSLLDGIPQQGTVLGSPDAPVTLVEYADIQCPFCAQWSYDAFPEIVQEYVRTGKVRLVFNGLAFIGSESEAGLRAVLAAGEQGKAWNVLHLLLENQGAENSGWVTDDFLREVGAAVPGLDVDAVMNGRSSQAVTDEMAKAQGEAGAAGISSTPSFQVGLTGGTLERLEVDALTADAIRPALDELLAS